MMPLSFGADILNEYDFAQASCVVRKGDQPMKISWSFQSADITSDTGIIITPLGTKASMLSISSVDHKHRGNYTCTAKNKAGSSRQTVELRVNGNLILIKNHRKALKVIQYFSSSKDTTLEFWNKCDE